MNPFVCFLLTCAFIDKCYLIGDNVVSKHFTKFNMFSNDRKLYILKNLIKGFNLCILVLLSLVLLLPDLMKNNWNNTYIKCFASMYVANDAIGLMKLKNMKPSTQMHHIVTILFMIYSWSVDFNTSNIGRLLFVYTLSSAMTGTVNIYLGLRWIYKDVDNIIRDTVKYQYLFICLFNWIYQCLHWESSLEGHIYILLLIWIIVDDVILLNWLWNTKIKQ